MQTSARVAIVTGAAQGIGARLPGSWHPRALESPWLTLIGKSRPNPLGPCEIKGVLIVAMLGVMLVGINLLISKNRYDVFYVLCGVELIAAIAIARLKLLIKPET